MQIPEGFKPDAKGNLVMEANIKAIDKMRDGLVMAIIEKGKEAAAQVADFKDNALTEIAAFVELSAAEYGAKLGGTKGNVTLISFDGRYKVIRAKSDTLTFDERLLAAKELIDECLAEWTQDSNANVRTLITRAFQANKAGEISTARVMELRRVEIDDERWLRAMDALADSLTVAGSKTYIRIYERVGDSDKYRQISLDGSAALSEEGA